MKEQPDTEQKDQWANDAHSETVVKTEPDAYQQEPDAQLDPLRSLSECWKRRRIFPPTPWVRILECLAVAVAVGYSVLTYQLWRTAQSGQRAYLLIENVRLRGKLDICIDRPKYGEMNVA